MERRRLLAQGQARRQHGADPGPGHRQADRLPRRGARRPRRPAAAVLAAARRGPRAGLGAHHHALAIDLDNQGHLAGAGDGNLRTVVARHLAPGALDRGGGWVEQATYRFQDREPGDIQRVPAPGRRPRPPSARWTRRGPGCAMHGTHPGPNTQVSQRQWPLSRQPKRSHAHRPQCAAAVEEHDRVAASGRPDGPTERRRRARSCSALGADREGAP